MSKLNSHAKEVLRFEKRERRRRAAMERLLRVLNDLTDSDRSFVRSLVAQWQSKSTLSDKQWHWVERLAESVLPGSLKPTRGPCYIYAIQSESAVKIGISKQPSIRLRDLQVANESTLHLLWSVLAPTRTKAKNIERRVHKRFRDMRMKGEWFDSAIATEARNMAESMAANTASGDRARWPSDPVADPAAPDQVDTGDDPERIVNTGGNPHRSGREREKLNTWGTTCEPTLSSSS